MLVNIFIGLLIAAGTIFLVLNLFFSIELFPYFGLVGFGIIFMGVFLLSTRISSQRIKIKKKHLGDFPGGHIELLMVTYEHIKKSNETRGLVNVTVMQ